MQILPLSCTMDTDYVDVLLFTTLWPFGLVGCLFIVFVADLFYQRRNLFSSGRMGVEMMREADVLKDRLICTYFSYFLLITYFILPSVTLAVFAMYPCKNVDPQRQVFVPSNVSHRVRDSRFIMPSLVCLCNIIFL